MAQVSVTIAAHVYRVACGEGEEAHLQGLARQIDERIERLKREFGEIGDQRLTIMAAITIADELAEAMEARGYHRGPRTALRELRIDGQDFAALAWMLIFIALLAISRVYVN